MWRRRSNIIQPIDIGPFELLFWAPFYASNDINPKYALDGNFNGGHTWNTQLIHGDPDPSLNGLKIIGNNGFAGNAWWNNIIDTSANAVSFLALIKFEEDWNPYSNGGILGLSDTQYTNGYYYYNAFSMNNLVPTESQTSEIELFTRLQQQDFTFNKGNLFPISANNTAQIPLTYTAYADGTSSLFVNTIPIYEREYVGTNIPWPSSGLINLGAVDDLYQGATFTIGTLAVYKGEISQDYVIDFLNNEGPPELN